MSKTRMSKVVFLVFGIWLMVVMPLAIKGETSRTTAPPPSSTRRPSVVNVGALFSVNSVIGRSAKPAIAAAIEDVNSSPTILQETRLNLMWYDANCSGFLGTIEGTFLRYPFKNQHLHA